MSSLVSVALLCDSASARILEPWDHAKLLAKSDLVVIAIARDTAITTDSHDWTGIKLEGRNTRFEVQSVLKGEPAKGPIAVLHFKVKLPPKKPGELGPIGIISNNAPTTLTFKTALPDGKSPCSVYLLYLRATTDGRYEPVSGRIDPYFSVMSIGGAPMDGLGMPFDADGRPQATP